MNTAPPPKLTASAPVLLVKDVVAAAEHYRDRMGFRCERFWGDPPAFVILSVRTRQISPSVFRLIYSFVFVLAFVSAIGLAVEPPIPPGERGRMIAEFSQQVATLGESIARAPREIALYSQRGDLHLFLARFPAAVADFEKMIALDPAQDAPHWRLGIAYYFTGQFEKSAKQFEKYHAYDNRDRENGIWKFLGDVKVAGLQPARGAMLVYTRFDREPFPSLYEMFAGKLTTREFLTGLDERKLTDSPKVMFFANYYAGLHEDMLGRQETALPLLHAAVANSGDRTPLGGRTYMWQVARLHYETLGKR